MRANIKTETVSKQSRKLLGRIQGVVEPWQLDLLKIPEDVLPLILRLSSRIEVQLPWLYNNSLGFEQQLKFPAALQYFPVLATVD